MKLQALLGQVWAAVTFGQTTKSASLPVTLASDQPAINVKTDCGYETIDASQVDQVLGTSGSIGDFLSHLVVVVATPATAQVQIKDGGGSAITVFPDNPGGGVGTYHVALGLASLAGAWKVSTGAGVSVIGVGNFT